MHTPTEETDVPDEQDTNQGSPYGPIPAPPKPSADLGVKETIPSPSADSGAVPPTLDALDITTLTPLAALTLLTASVKSVISEDSDSPPTPPISSPTTPKSLGFDKSEKSATVSNQDGSFDLPLRNARFHREVPSHHKTPIGSPETQPQEVSEPKPPQLSLDGTLSEYDHQCLAMARSFQCKVPPPIPLNAYLVRIHRYCPMSTAVYIAAAHYIQRITHGLWTPTGSEANATIYVQITPRSVHRLVLGSLRVATKALEDHNWPHARFAGVGGVPQTSLTRLEIAICYLLEFKLFISKDALGDAAEWLLKNGMQLENRPSAT
ncbi:hypothetical protein MMC10_004703 [Thelotrema lepadinum]|nr:hypothetical protein [Thelotrema lepadinum]